MSKQVKFSPELVPLILRNEKTRTFRLFDDKGITMGDELEFVNASDYSIFTKAVVTDCYIKQFGMLDIFDLDGHEKYAGGRRELVNTFRKYYGDKVNYDTEVKIVSFKLIDGKELK